MDYNARIEELLDDMSVFEDWTEKYEFIISIGRRLPAMPEKFRKNSNLIKGCQSRVWLQADLTPEGKVHFQAESDALIVKGIVTLLIRVLDQQTPDDILSADLHFIEDIGLKDHLSPTRSNGLVAMLKQMKLYAMAFKAKMG